MLLLVNYQGIVKQVTKKKLNQPFGQISLQNKQHLAQATVRFWHRASGALSISRL
jgi:hypothetical protein